MRGKFYIVSRIPLCLEPNAVSLSRIVDSLSKADQLLSPPHSPETLDTFGPGGRAASSN